MEKTKCIYRRMTWRFISSLLLSLFFAQAASAAEYIWSANGVQRSTPRLVCEYLASQVLRPTGDLVELISVSTIQVDCKYYFWGDSNQTWKSSATVRIERSGDSCPDDSVYDPSTYECVGPEPDPCEPTIGQEAQHMHKVGDILPTGFSPSGPAPDSVCSNQCRYISPAPLGDAYRFINGNPAGAFQNYSYRGDGTTCTGSETPQEVPNPSKKPSSESSSDCTEKVLDAEGRVHYSCQTSSEFRDPGSMNCGQVNGATVCKPKTPTPKYEKKDSNSDTTETTNSDGSKSTSTTTTTTTTSCVGANACTSTTTTTTNTQGTNADGTPGGSSSTCVGDNCSANGGEDDGDEDDKEEEEECDPATDPNKCGQSSVNGEACDASVNCSGDAVQCAILRKQKEQTCADEKFREVTPEKVTELRNTLNSEFSGDDYQPLVAESSNTFDFASVIDTSSRFGGSCPSIPDLSFSWLEGATATVEFSTIMDQLCLFLAWMGYLLVAFAMRGAAEIIANGMK